MGFFGPYVFKRNKEKWWLHSKQKGKTTVYYFSKEPENALYDIPSNYKVVVNETSGMPMLKKIYKTPRGFKPKEEEKS